ncbi:hypothetical protein [Psychrilyobacter atlanticus]|uniref:hypothetical protein n=1 Tax=Psychrilyobacter atlanticus TaxID=271091 RepID=UPI00041C4561|nr:hypothetical protein [Psychrilyobacter atlanticus]
MKKIILGMMLVMGSLSFATDNDTNKVSDGLKNEKSQDQDLEKSVKISNIFDNYKPLNTNS